MHTVSETRYATPNLSLRTGAAIDSALGEKPRVFPQHPPETHTAAQHRHLAAVDLGSNTFRLQVGRVIDDQIYALDSLKEPVRLASGLTVGKTLDEAAQKRALTALSRFGQRLRGFEADSVRVVATSALRQAKNAAAFLPCAEEALGFPIEIISGREEARLIYIGAHHALPPSEQKRMVVDIGGGSTEFIIGRKTEPLLMESLRMGCVSYTHEHFPGGRITRRGFREAEMAAAREIQIIVGNCQRLGWGGTFGSSGTARSIANILEQNSLNPAGSPGITRQGLENLRERMIRADSTENLSLAGLTDDRQPVLPAGTAIMCAVFSRLNIEHMQHARGALRLGALYDLLGRFHLHDMRDATVRQFQRRHRVDARQAEGVEKTATALFSQLFAPLPDRDDPARDNEKRYLRWAAQLHEIGLSIAHGGFHKHGAYIINAADMPGFSRKDQSVLSRLVLAQRGNLAKLGELPLQDGFWHLAVCLRLSALLHRSRINPPLPELEISGSAAFGYRLELPAGWLEKNPLSAAAFAEERQFWQAIGSGLRIAQRW